MRACTTTVYLIGLTVRALHADVTIPERTYVTNAFADCCVPNSAVCAWLERDTTISTKVCTCGTSIASGYALIILSDKTRGAELRYGDTV